MQDDPSYVREAFASGASGYLLKEAADAELVAAVREVAEGRRYVHPTLGARLAAAEAEAEARAAADPLSEREREVLRLLALGHTNQEIAKMLYISVRTAETHRAHIMQKLRLSTRAELVRYALQQGLLEEGESRVTRGTACHRGTAWFPGGPLLLCARGGCGCALRRERGPGCARPGAIHSERSWRLAVPCGRWWPAAIPDHISAPPSNAPAAALASAFYRSELAATKAAG